MCGICGFVDLSREIAGEKMNMMVKEMATAISHRGPDEEGAWVDPRNGIALGHRRLSIIDLTPTGSQPMESFCGRYVIVLNGEIYNFKEIRKELELMNIPFRGNSDTEVVLASVSVWGLQKTLGKIVGMFAFAIWDKKEHILSIARDRMGEKPLYYGKMGHSFLFGSELKALKAHPSWVGKINRDSLSLFLRHNYIPAPYSIFDGIFKLPPGTMIALKANDLLKDDALPAPEEYWSLRKKWVEGMLEPFKGSENEASLILEELLKQSVKGQMISDVPLGAFLSGGVDSSTIVALMQSQSKDPVKTFTIGFDEGAFNEANHAKIVARHIGTDHTEHYVSPEETLDVIPGLPFLWDEPFGDSSQIPTFLISRLARQKVTVSLSGDGGDELFAGYNRYVWAEALHRKLKFLPGLSRTLLGSLISIIPPRKWDSFFGFIAPINKSLFEHTLPGDKIHKLAEIIKQSRNENLYLALVSQWHDPDSVVLGGKEPSTPLNEIKTLVSKDLVPRMQYLDMVTYLPDDILVKVDRAAMGVSLESRVPFLDHRVVEFAARIPLSYKIHGKKGKKILRNVLYKYVPKRLIERPKMGFGVPVRDWLRGPLLDWANDLLSQKRLLSDGYFNPDPIQRKWQEHLSGSRNWEGQIWTILMFQSWLEKQ